MNLSEIAASDLDPINEFAEELLVRATVRDARLVVASMSEWPAYISGKVVDSSGQEVPVFCWFGDEMGERLKNEIQNYPKFFDAEIEGMLRDYVRGVGFSLHNCDILDHKQKAEPGTGGNAI